MALELSYKHNFEFCLADSIGNSGLASAKFEKLMECATESINKLADKSHSDTQSLFGLVRTCEDLETLETIAEQYCEFFDHVIVLGTGGSSLGGQALTALAPIPRPKEVAARPTLHFMANIDPDSFERLFQKIEAERTGFLVISKSGSTAETMAQFIYCMDVFRKHLGQDKFANHFTSITEPGHRPLREMSETHGITVIDHHPAIGGRYSALSATGMLPAMIAGLDGEALRSGAASLVDLITNSGSARDVAPAVGAVLAVGLAQYNGITASVLMPYLDRLEIFGKWYRQLWAESLGKDGKGTTPIDALGTVDQHSQLQLYLDGPKDKFFTLIISEMIQKGGLLPKDLINLPELAYLAGRSVGDLMAAEQQATIETLVARNCPTRVLEIRHLDEYTLGALMMHFMLETIIAADLMDVNPFNQPAVEEGKVLVRKMMNERNVT